MLLLLQDYEGGPADVVFPQELYAVLRGGDGVHDDVV